MASVLQPTPISSKDPLPVDLSGYYRYWTPSNIVDIKNKYELINKQHPAFREKLIYGPAPPLLGPGAVPVAAAASTPKRRQAVFNPSNVVSIESLKSYFLMLKNVFGASSQHERNVEWKKLIPDAFTRESFIFCVWFEEIKRFASDKVCKFADLAKIFTKGSEEEEEKKKKKEEEKARKAAEEAAAERKRKQEEEEEAAAAAEKKRKEEEEEVEKKRIAAEEEIKAMEEVEKKRTTEEETDEYPAIATTQELSEFAFDSDEHLIPLPGPTLKDVHFFIAQQFIEMKQELKEVKEENRMAVEEMKAMALAFISKKSSKDEMDVVTTVPPASSSSSSKSTAITSIHTKRSHHEIGNVADPDDEKYDTAKVIRNA